MLGKELYRQTYAQWQGWSEAAEKDRLLAAAQLSSGERWRQFQALVEFSRNIQVVPGLDYAAIRSALRSAFPDTARQAAPQNPLIVSVAIQDVIVDFLLALPGYEEMIIERAELGNLGSWSAWICSAEDLVIRRGATRLTRKVRSFVTGPF